MKRNTEIQSSVANSTLSPSGCPRRGVVKEGREEMVVKEVVSRAFVQAEAKMFSCHFVKNKCHLASFFLELRRG